MTTLLRALGLQAPRTFTTLAQPRLGSHAASLSDRVQGAARNFCSDSSSRIPPKSARNVKPIEQNDLNILARAKKAAQVFYAARELPKNKNVQAILVAAKMELDESIKPLLEKAEDHFLVSEFPNAVRDYEQLQIFVPKDASIAGMLKLSKKYAEEPLPT